MTIKSLIQKAFLCALIVGLFVFLFLNSWNRGPLRVGEPFATSSEAISIRVVPEDMREYRTETYHFSLLYPENLKMEGRTEAGGVATITFQDPDKGEGFQIFIVPYGEEKVSEERFKQDVPSGVRESLTNITIDGTTAAAFYSTNALLGATREVWFVRGGFLYEVTTLKPLDAWLDGILETLKFI